MLKLVKSAFMPSLYEKNKTIGHRSCKDNAARTKNTDLFTRLIVDIVTGKVENETSDIVKNPAVVALRGLKGGKAKAQTALRPNNVRK